jgi:hypothetical protein
MSASTRGNRSPPASEPALLDVPPLLCPPVLVPPSSPAGQHGPEVGFLMFGDGADRACEAMPRLRAGPPETRH